MDSTTGVRKRSQKQNKHKHKQIDTQTKTCPTLTQCKNVIIVICFVFCLNVSCFQCYSSVVYNIYDKPKTIIGNQQTIIFMLWFRTFSLACPRTLNYISCIKCLFGWRPLSHNLSLQLCSLLC